MYEIDAHDVDDWEIKEWLIRHRVTLDSFDDFIVYIEAKSGVPVWDSTRLRFLELLEQLMVQEILDASTS